MCTLLAHRMGRAEARSLGDLVDGEVGGLQEVAGSFDALLADPPAGTDTDLRGSGG